MPLQHALPLSRDKALLAVLAVSALLFVLVVIEPLGPDNAVLHSIARDWVYYGRTPYIGSWDNNFPGIMLLHAIEIALLGVSGLAFRVFDVAIQLAFVAFLYRFLSRWLSQHTAALAAVLYACYYVAGSTYLFGQQDGYGMMLVILATAILSRVETPKLTRIVGSALIAGLSVLMRPTFLLYPGLLSLYLIVTRDLKLDLRRLPAAILYFAVSLVPIGLLLGYYATIPGGLDAFYTSTIRFNLDVYTALQGGSLWVELARTGLLIPFAVFGAIAIIRRHIVIAMARKDVALYFALILSGLFVVVLMGKYWRYQFAPFFMATIPLSAVGIDRSVTFIRGEVARHYALIASLILCSFIYYNPTAPLAFAAGLLQHRDPFLSTDAARRNKPDVGADAERAVLTYLTTGPRKTQSVEVCGFDPYLRLHLDRPCVGPYVTFHSIGFRIDTTNPRSHTDYQKAWQRSYVTTLAEHTPDIFVLNRKSPFWYLHDVYSDVLADCDTFTAVFSHYALRQTFGGYEVYERMEAKTR